MTFKFATQLLTREMFCGAAVATLVGLGLGAWATPPLAAKEPDPYAHLAINPPLEPAVVYGPTTAASWPAAQATAVPVSQTAWEPEASAPTESEAAVPQQIDWNAPNDQEAPPPADQDRAATLPPADPMPLDIAGETAPTPGL